MNNDTLPAQAKRLVGYFPSGAIHAQNYHVADIPAGQLSRVIYAFADNTMRGSNGSDLTAAQAGRTNANDAQGQSVSQ